MNVIKKKVLPLLIAAAMLSFAGCSDNGNNSVSQPENGSFVSENQSSVSESIEMSEEKIITSAESSAVSKVSSPSSDSSKNASYVSDTSGGQREGSSSGSSKISSESTDASSASSETVPESHETASSESPDKPEPSTVSVPSDTQSSNTPEYVSVPEAWRDNGIFSRYYDTAYNRMSRMSLDEKIGQMLMPGCPADDAVSFAQKYHLGGYVLFGRDFRGKSTSEVINACRSYIASQSIPMTITVDEEGGTVVRISDEPTLYDHAFRSPRDLYNEGGIDRIVRDTEEKSRLLSSLLIDVNFAPVCDISVSPGDFMYKRSLGENAQVTADYISAVTKASQKLGVSATLKHFPGYGNNVDTHTGIAIDNRPYSTFESSDFIPFKAGIDSGAHMVMVSHNIVNCMDSTVPASLSGKVHNILRDKLGFTGLILTDDLNMDAISLYSGNHTCEVAAVLAGNDMLILADNQVEEAMSSIRRAVLDGTIKQDMIDHAVTRILAWKYSKKMM